MPSPRLTGTAYSRSRRRRMVSSPRGRQLRQATRRNLLRTIWGPGGWSGCGTVLALHDLSDVLPAKVHITLPEAWRKRRHGTPEGVVEHYGDIAPG